MSFLGNLQRIPSLVIVNSEMIFVAVFSFFSTLIFVDINYLIRRQDRDFQIETK